MSERLVIAPKRGWAFGAAGIFSLAGAVAVGWGEHDLTAFFRAYLFAFLVCLSLALGCLCLLMLHHLTGGDWGARVRPAARAGALTLPLLAVMFVPLQFGLGALYPWARGGAEEELVAHRRPYLNVPFFEVRAAVYFAVWIGLALLLHRWRRQYEARPSLQMAARIRGWSAAGLILYLMTMSHAGIDWIMSRDTEFYSTAFGFVLTTGQTLAALAFVVVVTPAEGTRAAGPRSKGVLNDVGNIMLTLVILWTYVSFMEFLVIWMGNSGEDNSWFLQRGMAGDAGMAAWRIVGVILIVGQFFIPFYLLLFRKVKQGGRSLKGVAGLLCCTNIVEQYWLATPVEGKEGRRLVMHWVDPLALIGLLGIWMGAFVLIGRRLRPETGGALSAAEEGVVHE